MVANILFILAGVALIITFWNYFKAPKLKHGDRKSDYLKSAVKKTRGNEPEQTIDLSWIFQSKFERRRIYYRNEYLKSDEWKRKRYVVLRRDNWQCVYCGARATQVHHRKYAKKNIGKEPISWLVSVCKPCHERLHR